ncbi:MmgE/PrpD family protein [Carboxydochorda subterranea]|uniref:MmgE/PrpD family protein n=1 Tax=Carboxydichorda subterranea TaxID=3109565 RepID=A0ABZ1BVK4_9FIRM|nr:MmgE/PrpD family protein [Limnochorda sp. L945t]WRP16535.1 MmgE/PrpD family protein [Limnochorda sp. L945t]
MSDRFSRIMGEYAASVRWEDLPPETVHEVKRRLLDSVGVAMAAFTEDSPKAARAYAYEWPVTSGATLWGTAFIAPADVAAFANGVMVRYLDFNDTYLSKEPLHPSDVIPPLFAVAEWRGVAPREFVTAVAVAYEIGVNLCDAASLRRYGWDHVNYVGIATAAAAGRLLGLSVEQIEHAISLVAVPHAAMRQTRAGELSMWKGAAAANSARNAVFATVLASKGMTGPFQPFAGEMGFFRQLLAGETFDEAALASLVEKRPPRRICDTYVKFWPVEYHAQSAVDAALQLRTEIGDPSRIASIHIDTFKAAYEIIAKDPEKWEPRTRETADHSLPYAVVAALLDGQVTRRSFSRERIADPTLRKILKEHTTLQEDPELTRGYPEGIPNRIRVMTVDREEFVREVRFPRGHARNPMTDEEVVQKFRLNVEEAFSPAQADLVIDFVFGLERQTALEDLAGLLRL